MASSPTDRSSAPAGRGHADALRSELIRSSALSPLATIITDAVAPDNPVIAVNRAFVQLTGYDEGDILGANCRILAGDATAAEARAELRAAVSAGRPAFVTLTNYRKGGEAFRNAVMIAPVFDDGGRLAFFVGTQMIVDDDCPRHAEAEDRLAGLTPQQRRVLAAMARGRRNADIAIELGLSIKTVKMHRSALVRRLGLTTSTEAIRIAVEAGL